MSQSAWIFFIGVFGKEIRFTEKALKGNIILEIQCFFIRGLRFLGSRLSFADCGCCFR
jgi:hypothetical protein